jgi:predicted DNA-binding transcriptional regulator YafY
VADDEDRAVTFAYTNHRGEKSRRRVVPSGIRFGSTQYHAAPQWLLEGFDLDRQAERTFAMQDVEDWLPLGGPGG